MPYNVNYTHTFDGIALSGPEGRGGAKHDQLRNGTVVIRPV